MSQNRTTDQALERVAKKYGLTVDELGAVLEGKTQVATDAKPKDTEKYGRMLEVTSTLVRPFFLSRNKARVIVQVFDKIQAWADGSLK